MSKKIKSKPKTKPKVKTLKGVFSATQRGYGFVTVEGIKDDIFIPQDCISDARHRDTVAVKLTARSSQERRADGKITGVIERGITDIVGTYLADDVGKSYVVPDEKRLFESVRIRPKHTNGAVDGSRVVIAINEPVKDMPYGMVTEIIGHRDDPGMDIFTALRRNNIHTAFPDEALAEAEAVQETVSAEDILGRRDLRNQTVITIDGEDAKDLDDAISLKTLQNGGYELGVHIADVSSYVKHKSALDAEAALRGTSVYLVDRVVPMLPKKLSNGICSLHPGVDRLTLSCVMEIDKYGNVTESDIFPSVINSKRRMTYTEVNEIINAPKPDDGLFEIIIKMHSLSLLLQKKRHKRGSIEFGFPECKIKVDENGKPLDISIEHSNDATRLIEEFMLLSNETVAERFSGLKLPFIYRVHEEPDSEKMMKLSLLINKFGHRLKGSGKDPKNLQRLLNSIEGSPSEAIISRMALRSMKQARYSEENSGHYGLAAKPYCHFTSPIRRYPDLFIHRIIKDRLAGKMSVGKIKGISRVIGDICANCSARERAAEVCEREVDNIKKAEYLESRIGEEFDGTISGVTGWGIYVELANTVEGLVRIGDISGDYYDYDEENLRLVGQRTKKQFTLGDNVRIIVKSVDIPKGNIDFSLTD